MSDAASAELPGCRVVGVSPGRIRLRASNQTEFRSLASFAETLEARPEIISVALRERARSAVIIFDPAQASGISKLLSEHGIDEEREASGAAQRPPAGVIRDGAGSMNRAVARRLGGTDLRTLIPLGLGLMAVRSAMRGDERLSKAPWYVLAWYASETFWKFHGGNTNTPDQPANGEEK